MLVYTKGMGKKSTSDKRVENLLQDLAEKNRYLCLIYDGEYNHYVVEILTPYGNIESAGLSTEFIQAIDEAIENLLPTIDLEDGGCE